MNEAGALRIRGEVGRRVAPEPYWDANDESPVFGAKRWHSPQDHGHAEEGATRRSGHPKPDTVDKRGFGFWGGEVAPSKANPPPN